MYIGGYNAIHEVPISVGWFYSRYQVSAVLEDIVALYNLWTHSWKEAFLVL